MYARLHVCLLVYCRDFLLSSFAFDESVALDLLAEYGLANLLLDFAMVSSDNKGREQGRMREGSVVHLYQAVRGWRWNTPDQCGGWWSQESRL